MKRWLYIASALAQCALSAAAIAQQALPSAVLIFDSSNSMWTQIEGVNKVRILRESLSSMFLRAAPSIDMGLVTYGHKQANSCAQVDFLLPIGRNDAVSLSQAVNAINPAQGATPLAAALEIAATATGIDGRGDIIVITDGNDNCRRDVCQAARQLHADYELMRIHVIGFGLTAKRELKDLNCVADATGGGFYLTSNRTELDNALLAVAAMAALPRSDELPLLAAVPNQGDAEDVTGAAEAETTEPQAMSEITQGADQPVPPSLATAPADAMRQINSQVQQEQSQAAGSIRLAATLTSGSPILTSGMIWRVFSSKPDADGTFKVVARSEDANPVFELAAGTYFVHLAYGRANATRDVSVVATKNVDEVLNLDAGGLRLRAVLPGGKSIPENLVTYAIYAPEQDQLGERKLVMPAAEPGKIIRLNAGNYHIVSQYGDANAVVRSNVAVQAGRLSEATVNHSASRITLKLVNEPGGEALANTSWSILNTDGSLVAESVGAFPSHILAAGEYSVLARHEGKGFNRSFNVQAGLDQEVELVASE